MNWIRRTILGGMILAAALLLAFGPDGKPKDLPPDFVVVDYWEKWTADEAAQLRQIVDGFNQTVGKEKHIYVRLVSTSDIEQKTKVATAAGVPPDIAGLYDGNLAQFAALGAIQPLEEIAASHNPPITADTYKSVYWKACHYQGHLYALISTPCAIAMHYNTKIFHDCAAQLRAAGLNPDDYPRTIDQVDAYSKVFETFKGNHLERGGYLPTVPGWYTNQTYMWFGGEVWDPVHEKFTLTDPAVVRAYTWLQSYSKRLGPDAINTFQAAVGNFDSPQNEFMSGTVVMEQQGPWMANFIFNRKPQMDGLKPGEKDDPSLPLEQRRARMQWAVAPFPSAVPGLENVSYCAFDTLVIPTGAKHPREAFEFIAYINRQDVMEHLCDMHSKNSPLRKVSRQFLEHSKNPYMDVFEALASSPNARSLPQVPIWEEAAAELKDAIQRIALVHATPEEALGAAQTRLQASYDRYAAKQRARKAALAAK